MTDWPRGGYAASNTPASELKPPPASMISKQRHPAAEATYTAAEVKVLTETASKVAYELGRKDAGEEIAAAITAHRDADDSTREFRLGLSLGAKFARDMASQPSQTTSDAISVPSESPGTSEPSKAAKTPQGES